MPKSIIIEPERVFASETIQFAGIPVNAYHKSAQEELAGYSPEDLLEYLAGHVRYSGIRNNSQRNKDKRNL